MSADTSRQSAKAFADHRRTATGFATFPEPFPVTLGEAYEIQAEANLLWDRPIAGWKVGRITGFHEETHGENRFVGPIYADSVWDVEAEGPTPFPAVRGGFAALEAELVAVVDVPAPRSDWTAQSCREVVKAWHIGIEVAGSPLAPINDLGPLASIAGFGNNLGLILGPEVALSDPDAVSCVTTIDGETFGPRTAGQLPGGPFEAIAFALNRLNQMGYSIPSGTVISTGAVTGVHVVTAGQDCTVAFAPGGTLSCRVVDA